MEYRKKYEQWLKDPFIDSETKNELKGIQDNEREIEDRFYQDLEFGTAGLRGIIGAGSNRMNRYTVGRATQGFANYIKKQGPEAMDRGVVIAYDSRHMSQEFAEMAALVLNGNGIKTYLYSELQPTPILSFSVRELRAIAGIVITASHNPPEYNGYKVYWEDGAQVGLEKAEKIIHEIHEIKDFSHIKDLSRNEALDRGLLIIIGEDILKKYIDKVLTLSSRDTSVEEARKGLKIIYTPLHGSGNKPVRRVLDLVGYKNLRIVPEQEEPDPNFTTVGYPNPEEQRVFSLAIEMANKEEADIIIGTDPDCDRLGVVVRDMEDEYIALSGNQIGALLVDYILGSMDREGNIPDNGTIIKTVVTSHMGEKVAKSYGVDVIDTLTGFKFIGEKMKEFEKTSKHTYLFGYEESYGYLAGDFVRDKDAVSSSMLVCEMAAYYKSKDMSLYEGLLELWDKHGYFYEENHSIEMEGKEGMERIKTLMGTLRDNPPKELGGSKIIAINDYKAGKNYDLRNGSICLIDLPASDVLKYRMDDDSWFAIRPSGTEPKIKLYFSTIGKDLEDAKAKTKNLESHVLKYIEE